MILGIPDRPNAVVADVADVAVAEFPEHDDADVAFPTSAPVKVVAVTVDAYMLLNDAFEAVMFDE